MKVEFTRKIAKDIAMKSFLYVIDCIRGYSDSGYDLSTSTDEFEQNFEEDLEEKNITVTNRRLRIISEEYEKLLKGLTTHIDKKYK